MSQEPRCPNEGREPAKGEKPEPVKPRRPRDVTVIASEIIAEATGEKELADPDAGKDPDAVARGRKGGAKGGKARAANLTAQERKEAARVAASARWKKSDGA